MPLYQLPVTVPKLYFQRVLNGQGKQYEHILAGPYVGGDPCLLYIVFPYGDISQQKYLTLKSSIGSLYMKVADLPVTSTSAKSVYVKLKNFFRLCYKISNVTIDVEIKTIRSKFSDETRTKLQQVLFGPLLKSKEERKRVFASTPEIDDGAWKVISDTLVYNNKIETVTDAKSKAWSELLLYRPCYFLRDSYALKWMPGIIFAVYKGKFGLVGSPITKFCQLLDIKTVIDTQSIRFIESHW